MALNRLGDVARCENRYLEAEQLYTEALGIFRDSGDQEEIAILLHNLGCVAQVRGDPSQALALFREALLIQSERKNPAGMAACLAGIAYVSAARGELEYAARLLGTAEAARERAGAVLWPADCNEYEDNLSRLSRSLGEEALAAAWETGRGMSIEQAAERALD
jgi:tetratricopeptide (TPR) repeat protein